MQKRLRIGGTTGPFSRCVLTVRKGYVEIFEWVEDWLVVRASEYWAGTGVRETFRDCRIDYLYGGGYSGRVFLGTSRL